MRIGVEASRANRPQRTGVEWYARHLMHELAALPQAAAHEWVAYTEQPLDADLRASIPGWEERVLRWPPRYLWTQIRLSREMQQYPPDVLFVPSHVLPRILPKKTVVTVHDVGFHRFPHLYKKIQVAYHEITTRDIVSSHANILTVSEFSKRELIELYHASPNQITVTPLGLDHARYRQQTPEAIQHVREKYHLPDTFLFYVGRLEEKKNIDRLVKAFCEVSTTLPAGTELILAGLEGHGWKETQAWLQTHPQGKRVRVLGYLAEEDKPALTAAATGYIQASLYEGFGLPVVEAMACGTPILCSNTTSLPEIVGDARVLLFDPRSQDEISSQIQQLFGLRTEVRQEMITSGLQRAQQFTWKHTAEATLPVLLS